MHKYPLAALLAVSVIAAGRAQTSNAPSVADSAVVLSPFTVNTSRDVGFVGTSSLAGGRLATPLKDTPVAYSVLTHEFIEAFNVNDLEEAGQYTVNSNTNPSDNADQGFAFSGAMNVSLRGLKPASTDFPSRNFFPYNSPSDSFDVQRFDFARGPNAVLFGAGNLGGNPNIATKQAVLGQPTRELQFGLGSWQYFRATADVNQPINDKVAVRSDVVWQRQDTWRDQEWLRKKGAYLTATFQPTSAWTIKAEGEVLDHQQAKAVTSLKEHLSGWDGKTTFATTPTGSAVPTGAQQNAAGIASYSSNGAWIYDPTAFGTNAAINFAHVFRTKGASQSSGSSIDGVKIVTPGLSFDGTSFLYDPYTPDRFGTAVSGSPYLHLPTESTTTLWKRGGEPTQTYRLYDAEISSDYQLGDSLFFEVAADVNKTDIWGNNAINRGVPDVYLDINRTLPTGAANPNFLQPYDEFWTYTNDRKYQNLSYRAQVVYAKTLSWGTLRLSEMAGITDQKQQYRALEYLLPLTSLGADARAWVQASGQSALYFRNYLNGPRVDFYHLDLGPLTLVDPTTGTSQSVQPYLMYDTTREDNNTDLRGRYKYLQSAANFDLFHNKLVLIGAVRRDFVHYQVKKTIHPGDYNAGWNGTSLAMRPDAPSDYLSLMYTPKDATGKPTGAPAPADARPRANVNGVQTPLAQYAQDRFRDDYNPPVQDRAVNSFTAGATYNVTRTIGLYANASSTFKINAPLPRIDGSLVEPANAHGTDVGVRYTMPDNRLSASLGLYHSYQKNTPTGGLPGGFGGDFNAIYGAPIVGDLSASGRNRRNAVNFPTVITDVESVQASGVEFEATANVTPEWRVMVNASYNRSFESDAYPDSIAYAQSHDTLARQILADAGVVLDGNDLASINPAYNDPTKINLTAVTAAVNAWNNLHQLVLPNIISGRRKLSGEMEQTANFFTDYRFRGGPLKNLIVGGGINWRGRSVLGYRGSDTIVDPASPAATLHDPTVSAYTTVWSSPYYLGEAHVGYQWEIGPSHTLHVDLNIKNLFNRRHPINAADPHGAPALGSTTLRPRDNDIAQKAVVTVPNSFYYVDPISFTFRATLDF